MDPSMKAYTEEIFGPVLCVVTVDTLDEVPPSSFPIVLPFVAGNRADQLEPLRQWDGHLHEQWSHCKTILQRDRCWTDRGERGMSQGIESAESVNVLKLSTFNLKVRSG